MSTQLVNLTPATLNIYAIDDLEVFDGSMSLVPRPGTAPLVSLPSQGIATTDMRCEEVGLLEADNQKIPVYEMSSMTRGVNDLPPQQAGITYVMTTFVAMAAFATGRIDILYPVGAVVDREGNLIGHTGLIRM
jgi:hypothetical protein